MNDTARRALRGYGVGAGLTVLAASAALGPFFPWGLMVGTVLALAAGIFLVLPACLLLARLDQLRPWWAALLGALALLLPLVALSPGNWGKPYHGPGEQNRYYIVVDLTPTGNLAPNWQGIGITAFGAVAGLIGWAAAYGFRLRPESKNAGDA
jgi:hypothetical protein